MASSSKRFSFALLVAGAAAGVFMSFS